jgi:hypothetical protein
MKSAVYLFVLALAPSLCFGQSASVSPSRLYFKTSVGDYKLQEVTISNNSTRAQAFTISFGDFEPAGMQGKSTVMQPGESPNSCAGWLSADPSYFEVPAGQSKKVKVMLQVPATPEADKVKWAAMKIRLSKEKNTPAGGNVESIGMGITETFQFVIHIFQSPPSVTHKLAEILEFKEVAAENSDERLLILKVKNTGEAILDCASYLELTNLKTGYEERRKPFAYTLLPGSMREVKFVLPGHLEKGKYSVLGVVDYGSRESVQAAEMEIVY